MEKAQEIIREIIKTAQLERADIKLVKKAYEIAEYYHREQKRKSGDPYVIHTLETGLNLARIGLDSTTIAAGILHDTIEDTALTAEELRKQMGEKIAFLVEGVTRLEKVHYSGLVQHVKSMQRLFVSTARDPRVMIIKLCDRLHNMRTLSYLPKEKQERIAEETFHIYIPIADRLGIKDIRRELEDLCFKYRDEKNYTHVKKIVDINKERDTVFLDTTSKILKKELQKKGIKTLVIECRSKGLYSLHKKMSIRQKELYEIYDILAVRIVVPTISDCYEALGIAHILWNPIPGRLKDYIATPKPNGYRSLQTVLAIGEKTFELQLRTMDMHLNAKFGIAARYKDKREGIKKISINFFKRYLKNDGVKEIEVPQWIHELAESYKETDTYTGEKDAEVETFFKSTIFVYTPKGDVIELPRAATPIDFAYQVHTDLGNHIQGVIINGKYDSIRTPLSNGDRVLIVTSKKKTVNSRWLEYVKTYAARNNIRKQIESSTK